MWLHFLLLRPATSVLGELDRSSRRWREIMELRMVLQILIVKLSSKELGAAAAAKKLKDWKIIGQMIATPLNTNLFRIRLGRWLMQTTFEAKLDVEILIWPFQLIQYMCDDFISTKLNLPLIYHLTCAWVKIWTEGEIQGMLAHVKSWCQVCQAGRSLQKFEFPPQSCQPGAQQSMHHLLKSADL